MAEIKLLNERKSVGFPEGQLLANGATDEQAAFISEAFHRGEPIPTTGNQRLDRIAQRLTEVTGYGTWRDNP